jgi:hypothetical protein
MSAGHPSDGDAMQRLRVLLLGMGSLGWWHLDWEMRRSVLNVVRMVT